jgi:hypothetical protein
MSFVDYRKKLFVVIYHITKVIVEIPFFITFGKSGTSSNILWSITYSTFTLFSRPSILGICIVILLCGYKMDCGLS